MANSKEIKNRIKSVKSTKKITKAMELVAASKMKRAVAATISSRMYAEYSFEVLVRVAESLAGSPKETAHPLFQDNQAGDENQKILLLVITSNRGLCGAYNAQVIKKVLPLLARGSGALDAVDIITVGKKGDVAMRRLGQNVVASFTDLPDSVSLTDVLPIAELSITEYLKGNYGKVFVAYTDFISALTQKANIKQLLPVSETGLKDFIDSVGKKDDTESVPAESKKIDYLIEGDRDALLGNLAEKITRMQVYQMILEGNASEQSSRMIAMKNASEASGEMIDDLTLVFNKARQTNITREISEISAGMASVS